MWNVDGTYQTQAEIYPDLNWFGPPIFQILEKIPACSGVRSTEMSTNEVTATVTEDLFDKIS